MSKEIFNSRTAKDKRQELRNNLTQAEAFLWRLLQHSKLGKKFRRQYSVGPYVLDFYCAEERLAIELDGAAHFTDQGMMYDEERTRFLEGYNIRVLRFENKMVLEQQEAVLDMIKSSFRK